MEPTQQNIIDLEKYLDALQQLGVGAEFRPGQLANFMNFYVWSLDNPGNQLYMGSVNTDTPKAALIAPMIILAVITDSHYDEVIDLVKEINGDEYEPRDHPFSFLKMRLVHAKIIRI